MQIKFRQFVFDNKTICIAKFMSPLHLFSKKYKSKYINFKGLYNELFMIFIKDN